jgi:hypothetical protein
MKPAVKQWLDESRAKLRTGDFSEADIQRLENLLAEPKQMVLYLYSKSTNMRSRIASWALCDPIELHEPTQTVASDIFPVRAKLPSQDAPYASVMEAVGDGWRVVQFPRPELHPFSDVDNNYLGYEFILEK